MISLRHLIPISFRRVKRILKVFIAIVLFLVAFVVIANAEVVDLNTIQQIESAGNPNAVGLTGDIGLYQITPCVLEEYNTFNKANYSRIDLFNPIINEQIARWYLTRRIPQLLRRYGKKVNTRNCIIAYNAGIRAVIRSYCPKTTKNYLAKYKRLVKA